MDSWILLQNICSHYGLEISFFTHLQDVGLIGIETFEECSYVHKDQMPELERIIRIYHELELSPEGIDVVFNLLQRIDALQKELSRSQNRLRLYED